MRTPVGVVQLVGVLMMVYEAVVTEFTPSGSGCENRADAKATASERNVRGPSTGRATTLTDTDRRQAADFLQLARHGPSKTKRNGKARLRVVSSKGPGASATPEMLAIGALRSWAVKRNQKPQRLLQILLYASPEIGLDDALLVQHYANMISIKDTEKVNTIKAPGSPCDFSCFLDVALS